MKVVVVPAWVGRLMDHVLSGWLAITLWDHCYARRPLSSPEKIHELTHYRQWHQYGRLGFSIRYLWASLVAARSKDGWYYGNRYEIEAYAAQRQAEEHK